MSLLPTRGMMDPEMGAYGAMPNMTTPAAPDPFVWGAGGARLSPEQLAQQLMEAKDRMRGDYSPVGHWTQGLARASGNILSALEAKKLEKKQGEATEKRGKSIASLLGAGNEDLAGAFSSGDPVVQALAGDVFGVRNRKPTTNDTVADFDFISSKLGADEGLNFLKSKANPIQWIQASNPDGTKTLIPMGPNGPMNSMGGGGQASPGEGSVPAGLPLTAAPNSFVVDGKQYWEIGGKVYDNPEGRR
jgi:hypothetical protein